MKDISRRHSCFVFLAALALSSALSPGQKRDDILSIQRDVAQLQDQVKQLQAGQDQKMGALENLVRQALEDSGRMSAAAGALQRILTDRLKEQQGSVEGPVAALGSKVDQSSDDLRSVRENLADLSRRLAALDNKLADISSAVRTLSSPPVAPPPTASDAPLTAVPRVAAPHGVTAESLWRNAVRNYSEGKDKAALTEFANYLKYYPDGANAAEAQYDMGLIYDHGEQYDDAAQVFQAVIERYPDSPKAVDAMYMKGVAYQKAGNDKQAIAAYRMFVKQHPAHPNAAKAQARLRALTAGTGGKAARKRK